MKRYLLFAGAKYYPGGGWEDFKDSFDTLDEARGHTPTLERWSNDWWQIVDTQTGEVEHGSI